MLDSLFDCGCRALSVCDFPESVRLFREALAAQPELPELWNNLGISLFHLGERREAVDAFGRALQLRPRFAEALNNQGRALAACGLPEQGLAACRESLEVLPDFAGGLENAGFILLGLGRHREALACFTRVCELSQHSGSAWINHGIALRELGRLDAAFASFRRARALAPGESRGAMGLASLYLLRGDIERSIALLREAAELDPEDAQLHSALLMALNYSHLCSQKDLADESRLWGALHGESLLRGTSAARPTLGRRLRIGYVSADLCRHPVGFFLMQVLKHHDRCAFEITCYQSGTRCDEITAELRQHAERWFVIAGMSDEQAHQLIVSNGIDILVDLSGHTAGNRLSLIAAKPAPIQASWIGNSSSTGLPAIGYLITDVISAPPGEEGYYSERLIRLPHCRFCYAPPAPCPFVDALPAAGNGFVTFGSFNNLAKLTPPVIALWSRLLQSVPGSRLVLKWKSLAASSVRRRLRALFASHGVDPQRIEYRGASNHFLALAEYNDIDIALDPFPFNGGLTSCEALWMGVPVLTLLGTTPIGRQTAAFLETIGLPELIARDEEEFLAQVASLAGDLGRLAALREGLRDRMAASPLCDGARFARDLEQGYRSMLLDHCSEKEGAGEAGAATPSPAPLAAALAGAGGAPRRRSEPVLVPPERLRVAYLVPDPGAPELSEWLETIPRHNREALAPYLYFGGELCEPLRAAALAQGVRLRPVGLLDEELVARLLRRERIDLLVDLGAEGAPPCQGAGPCALPLRLRAGELPPAGLEAEPALRRGAHAARLEAFYWEHWLDFFVAQRRPRRASKPATAAASRPLVERGRELRLAGCLEEAQAGLSEAVRLDPRNADALRNLGEVYLYQGRVALGLAVFRRALLLDPGHLKAHSNLLFAMNYSERYDGRQCYLQSRAWEKAHGRFPAGPEPEVAGSPHPARRLRVGYLSADFYRHAVSSFLEPLLANHDRAGFEIFCYSFVARPDQTTARLQGLVSQWRDCARLGDDEVARLVREDRIDILVDLAGHSGARILLPVPARRPASIQVSWLGYPNTTGLSALDYRLTDAAVDPAGEGERHYAERLVRLPGGFLCYQPPHDAPDPEPAPAAANGFVTLGSFNMLPKLSDATVAAWAAIMLRLPEARLWLKSPPLGDRRTRERLLSRFAQLGIAGERVTLAGPLPTIPEHLACYRELDLALDPFPYNGTTTTCEALWMGVPVLALDGDRHAGRVSGSLLRRLGLEELVAADLGEYLERAVALAQDPVRLSGYRKSLRPLMAGSLLCDGRRFAAEVENAYLAMWRARCTGASTRPRTPRRK